MDAGKVMKNCLCSSVFYSRVIGIVLSLWAVGYSFADQELPKSRVLVGSVVNRPPEILEEFLGSLSRLPQDEYTLDYLFVDANGDARSCDQLKIFANQHQEHCSFADGKDAIAAHKLWIWVLADLKDQMIKKARDEGYDYLFLVDSDLVLHPKTIEQLISAKKDIVSNIFWTNSGIGLIPQVWLYDADTQYEVAHVKENSDAERERCRQEFFSQLKIPGTYEVGGLGACTLISKNALKKDISFRRVNNVTFDGEDRHFCLRAIALEIPLFVDTHYPAYHIVRATGDSSLAGVVEFKTACGI